MNETTFDHVKNLVLANVVPFAWTILGALALWIIGGWVINAIKNLSQRAMVARGLDPTLIQYIESALPDIKKRELMKTKIALNGHFKEIKPPEF